MRVHPIVSATLLVIACGGAPWTVAGAPDVPPDVQFRTGVEAGEDVYVWDCYKGHRVVVHQYGSACFGTRSPELDRGPCGAPLPVEAHYPALDSGLVSPPDELRWPGSPPVPPFGSATATEAGPATATDAGPATATEAGPATATDARSVTGAALSPEVMKRAVAAANAALDRAYQQNVPHKGPWVTESEAQVSRTASGYTVTWMHVAPAGFEWSATVVIGPSSETKVITASATFSAD